MFQIDKQTHTQAYGLTTAHELIVLGVISEVRTESSTTYMAGNGVANGEFRSPAAASDWLAQVADDPIEYVLLGRIWRPERHDLAHRSAPCQAGAA
jgi:hypothetical protein